MGEGKYSGGEVKRMLYSDDFTRRHSPNDRLIGLRSLQSSAWVQSGVSGAKHLASILNGMINNVLRNIVFARIACTAVAATVTIFGPQPQLRAWYFTTVTIWLHQECASMHIVNSHSSSRRNTP